jgi:glycosyltransferase involved in cell wall biosynthesis
MTPDISIVMPTMRIGGLDVVFESLKHQTFKNFELIISDSLYKYRKDIVAQKAKEYTFTVKHIEPTKNAFPVSHFCNAENTALVYVAAKLVLMITDYTYLPKDCVEKHIAFHSYFPNEKQGFMGAHQYKSLPELNNEFPIYKHEDIDKYVSDIENGKLNNIMWSIFKNNFSQDPEILSLDSMGNADTKLFMSFHHNADQNLFNGKNESIKLEAALKINGWDEELDGTTPYQDYVFSDMLVKKLGFTWTVDGSNRVYIINPRLAFPLSKRLRTIESNFAIWERKHVNNFPNKINDWDLCETRNNIK